jgi:hypothetical protein
MSHHGPSVNHPWRLMLLIRPLPLITRDEAILEAKRVKTVW